MQVRIRLFASLREIGGADRTLEVPRDARIDAAWDALVATHPALAEHRRYVRAALNGRYAAWDAQLGDGDEVAFLPPVSGGASAVLTAAPIDVAALEASAARPGHGAVVTFIGRARDHSDDGRAVVELEYEVFPELASDVLEAVAAEAEARWGASVAVAHRYGTVALGEPAVAIVTATAHRAEAYEANRFVIEQIKERLPVWKRERFADGSEWKRPGA
jgi:MoaE-MoaD fusion protein